MIQKKSELKTGATEHFVEASQLADSHRRPVAWMLAVQVGLLGLMVIGVASPSVAAGVVMVTLLAGFLWYANSVWLTALLLVVIGARVIQPDSQPVLFVESAIWLDCALTLLTLIASFRYIELRTYRRTFELHKSFRQLRAMNARATNERSLATAIAVLGQLVRRQWYHTLLAMVAAGLLLWSIPTTKQWTQKYWLDPTGGRFIFLALALFLGWFVCRTVFSMWDWYGLTPKQADVAIRSWANREFWSETAGVERRRSKLRRADSEDD